MANKDEDGYKGKRRKVGEERTQVSPGDRRRIRHHDGKTRELPDHKYRKDKGKKKKDD